MLKSGAKPKYEKIQITRATIAGGEHVYPERKVKDPKTGKETTKPASVLTVGKDVTPADARYLVETGRAIPVGKTSGKADDSNRESRG